LSRHSSAGSACEGLSSNPDPVELDVQLNEQPSPLDRLQDLLRELFQLDRADLDFGVYRLLRAKRDEVRAFLEEQLPEAVQEAFAEEGAAERAGLENEVSALADQIRTDVDEDAIDADGSVAPEFRQIKAKAARELIARYEELRSRVESVRTTEAHQEEVFNHLYAFLHRYYEDGDFIPKRRYGSRERYAVPYGGEETLLHWANRDQHYVKNAEVLRDYAFTLEGDLLADSCRVRFTLTRANLPTGDRKGDSRYFFPVAEEVEWDERRRVLTVPFHYRLPTEGEAVGLGRAGVQEAIIEDRIDEVLDAIPDGAVRAALMPKQTTDEEVEPDETPPLVRHLRRFVKRQTSDYFVHRDLKGFLERELEFYLNDQVLRTGDLVEGSARLRMLRVLRAVAGQVIAFLSELEEVQRLLFEKRKFVLRTDYLVLMHAVPRELWEKVLQNQAQLEDWRRLFHLDPAEDLLNPDGEINETVLENHPTLVVNTAHFDEDFRDRLLEGFDDLDESIGGILIHSENYQALRLIEPRFRGEVRCIYIDPPYNTGSDDFLYRDRFQHSSWLSMMEERLALGRALLAGNGSMFVSIDDHEHAHLRLVADRVFGPGNFVDTVIWEKVYAPKSTARHFSASHDFITVHARSAATWTPNLLPRSDAADARYTNRDDDPRGPWKPSDLSARNYYSKGEYEVTSPSGKTFRNPPGTYWRVSPERFQELDDDNRIWWGEEGDNMPALKRFLSEVRDGMVPQTLWRYKDVGHTQEAKKELMAIVDFPRTEDVFQTVKPTRLIRRIIHLASDPGDWVVDYFAGSGSTGHAVLNHSREQEPRRFILIEQGAYFDQMVVQRISRAFYSSSWKERRPTRGDPGQSENLFPLVKVLRLESYEDALHNIAGEETLERVANREDAVRSVSGPSDYRLQYLVRLPLEASDTMLNLTKLEHPFAYEMEILTDEGPEIRQVDLLETFNLLYGLRVKRLERWVNEEDGDRLYRAVIGKDAQGRRTLVLWRDMADLDAGKERTFLESRIEEIEEGPFDTILINGDSTVPGVRSLDPEFKARLQAEAP
jgi:adenine-specific DNA-methyltransferase